MIWRFVAGIQKIRVWEYPLKMFPSKPSARITRNPPTGGGDQETGSDGGQEVRKEGGWRVMVNGSLIKLAKEEWDNGDIEGVLCRMPDKEGLVFVSCNIQIIKQRGLLEKVLFNAYVRPRTN